MTMPTCTIPGCKRDHNARGWCQAHYKRWQKHGDPLGEAHPWPDRFWRKVTKTSTCWVWDGARDPAGYGRSADGKGVVHLAHRVAYELLVGPIPPGLHLDHLCRVRACVRPDHLEAVTQAENNRRAAAKSECIAGHPLVDGNLYYRKNGRRECRECVRRRNRDAYRRKSAEAVVLAVRCHEPAMG